MENWAVIWTSTTTFTTTNAEWADAVVGDEVEILQGAGAGILGHIVSVLENAGTYTVTIDETFDYFEAGDDATAVFRNWKKWKTIEYGDSNAGQYYISEQLGSKGKFIQMKIELRGVNVTIEELLIDNVSRLPARGK
jgi:hypothetical protein